MDGLTAFGLFAVTAMLVTYALEARSPWFVLAFAGSCALGSAYGFLQGAWPFGLGRGGVDAGCGLAVRVGAAWGRRPAGWLTTRRQYGPGPGSAGGVQLLVRQLVLEVVERGLGFVV